MRSALIKVGAFLGLFASLALLTLVIRGLEPRPQEAEAAQVGIPLHTKMAPHGHSGPTDGGKLNAPSLFVREENQVHVVTANVLSKVQMTNKATDTAGNTYDIINSRHTPNTSGNYLYNVTVCGYCVTTFTKIVAAPYKNGSALNPYVTPGIQGTFTPNTMSCQTYSVIVNMNGTTDYFESWGAVNGTGACATYSSFMTAVRVSN